MKWVLIALAVVVLLVVVVAVVGALLPKAHVATRSARFKQSPEVVWQTITDVDAFPSWRADVKNVERLPDRDGRPVWREIGSHGSITLEVIESDPPRRLVGKIADPNLPFGGNWTYEIEGVEGGSTLTITENGEVYNPIFRFVSKFIMGHHKSIEDYLRAMGKKFGETVEPQPA
ncbi:MAG TPA: SRPBCC family protein [Blastocatellia bacterium]|nr:SRPBCC family protein [Blastocatellia bacterium]